MSEEQKRMEIADIIGLIDNVSKTLDCDVYIPSLNKEVKCKPLNTNHTKNILKSAIEGAFASNQFTLIMYQILQDVMDKSVDLSTINTLDKNIILLQLRAKNVSNFIEISLTSEKGNVIEHKVDINKFINKLKKTSFSFNNEIIETEKITTTISFPSIKEEYDFENNLYKTKLGNIDEKNEKAMRSLFAPMFINSAAQFISSVNIDGREISMHDRNIQERLAIVEKLPSIIDKVISKIDTVFGKQLLKTTTIEVVRDEETYTGQINLKAGFFVN